jgi:hypothetical protein
MKRHRQNISVRSVKAKMMNLYYRGHMVHQDIRSICYTVYGCRPDRIELAIQGTAVEAMQWIDQHIQREKAEGLLCSVRPGGW